MLKLGFFSDLKDTFFSGSTFCTFFLPPTLPIKNKEQQQQQQKQTQKHIKKITDYSLISLARKV